MRIYLDNNATTMLDPEVLEAMMPFLTTEYGNPSSPHLFGDAPAQAIGGSRERVAASLRCAPSEVVFTSGGTEANNMAILGVALARGRGRVVTSAVEHASVLETCAYLEGRGYELVRIPVDEDGVVDIEEAERAVNGETILVSVMAANNEVGTLQPLREIGELCRDRGAVFHTDAVQAMGKVSIDVERLHIDLLSLAAHKFHGPKGAGALFVREGTVWEPISHGGGQEGGRRPSTENVAGIVGLGAALGRAMEGMELYAGRMRGLRDAIIDAALGIEGTRLNGHPVDRLCNNVNVSFEGVYGLDLVVALSEKGMAASTASACSSGSVAPSHVLTAMGRPPAEALSSLRLGLSRFTTEEEVARFLDVLPPLVEGMR